MHQKKCTLASRQCPFWPDTPLGYTFTSTVSAMCHNAKAVRTPQVSAAHHSYTPRIRHEYASRLRMSRLWPSPPHSSSPRLHTSRLWSSRPHSSAVHIAAETTCMCTYASLMDAYCSTGADDEDAAAEATAAALAAEAATILAYTVGRNFLLYRSMICLTVGRRKVYFQL